MNPWSAQALFADPSYPALKDHLIRVTGLAYYADKDADLAGRLARRLAVRGLRDCASYLALLTRDADGEAELDALIKDLTIGETFFFRHREMFDALRDLVFPDLINRNRQSRRLRIWCAGCSVGAEPYSVSILLKRELAAHLAGWDVSIVGTDINREFLARARDGCFEDWVLRGLPDELKWTCFTRSGNGWLLAPQYREGVSFQYHNLVSHPFPSLLHDLADFDLILCRNVTIYFSFEIVRQIIDRFHQGLVEGGWLAVGHAEPNLELFRAFRTVNTSGAILYQKGRQGDKETGRQGDEEKEGTSSLLVSRSPGLPVSLSPCLPVSLSPTPPPPPPAARPAEDLDAIRSLANRGAWADAARLCDNLLARDNLNASAHFYHGLVLEQMGCHADAERSLRRVLYLDRNRVLAHYYLGLLLQRQGDLAQAVRSFRNGLRLLAGIDPGTVFADGDGITAGELKKLLEMHLEALEGV